VKLEIEQTLLWSKLRSLKFSIQLI
jgi:hypothetical protein